MNKFSSKPFAQRAYSLGSIEPSHEATWRTNGANWRKHSSHYILRNDVSIILRYVPYVPYKIQALTSAPSRNPSTLLVQHSP